MLRDRVYALVTIKSVDDDKRIIEGIASTPSTDLVGDVVDSMGAEFKLPIPLLWQHNHDEPIGEVFYAKPTKDGIPFKARIASISDPGRLKDRLDEAWQSIKIGLVKAVSIGFKSIEHSLMEDGGYHFRRWRWLELSAVTIPAQQEATIHTIRSIDRELRGASALGKRAVSLLPAGVSASPQSQKSGNRTMATISEQISALEAQKANLKSALKKFNVDNMNETDDERFDELKADLEGVNKKLDRLKVQEDLDVEKAVPVVAKAVEPKAAYQRTTAFGPNSNIPKGVAFGRMALCKAFARIHGGDPIALAERHFSEDPRIAKYMQMKAAVPAAYVGDAGGWAEDIAEAQTIGTEFIESLRAMTVIDRLPGKRMVPFNVKVPRFATGTTGYWSGENKPIPMTAGVFDTVTMGYTKVGSIAALTKEQIRFSNIAAQATITDDMRRAVVARMDATFVSATAASAGVSPAGILNGLSAIAANGSGAAADIRADLQDLYAPFSTANISRRGTVLVTTENLHLALQLTYDNGFAAFPGVTMDGGNALGWPVLATNHCGVGDVLMIATNEILVADDGQVDVSIADQASLEMLDASLVQDGTAGTGTSLVNLWQLDLIGIKVERFINWQKARSASVAFIGAAGWNGVATA